MSTSFSWSQWLKQPQTKAFLYVNGLVLVVILLVAWSHAAQRKVSNQPLQQQLEKAKRRAQEYYDHSVQTTQPIQALLYAQQAQTLWQWLRSSPEPLPKTWAHLGQLIDQRVSEAWQGLQQGLQQQGVSSKRM